jgi:hypothetical protein
VNGSRLRAGLGAVVAVLLASCGGGSGSSQGGSSNAFVFLTVDLAAVGAITSNLDSPQISTTVCALFANNLKNPTVTAPTPLDNVQITSYTVTFTRFDGGEPPGPFTINTSFTVPAGQAGTNGGPVTNNTAAVLVVLVPAGAKRAPPLHNPRPPLPLNSTATIVFQGRDGRGQRHEVEAAVTVVFLADDQTAEAVPGCTGPAPAPVPTPTPTPTPT